MTATATRTTKSGEITRSIAIGQPENGVCAAYVCEHKHGRAKAIPIQAYLLRLIPSQIGGVAVEVEKVGDEEPYHVLLSRPGYGDSCDCKWGSYKADVKPCRHIEMARQAIAEVKLTAARAASEPEAAPAANERAYETCGYCGGSGHTYASMYDRDGRQCHDESPLDACEYCGGYGAIEDGGILLPAAPREFYLVD